MSALSSYLQGANLLIDPMMQVNQAGFAGGALSAGAYGYDMWKAGTGGCTVSVSSGVITLDGPLVQVIEAPNIAGLEVTVSLDDPSIDVGVDIDGTSATIASGSGRQSCNITVPSGSTGNVTVTLSTASSGTFSRPQLAVGSDCAQFMQRPTAAEHALVYRYYWRSRGYAYQAHANIPYVNGTNVRGDVRLPVRMRAVPSCAASGAFELLGPSGSTTVSSVSFSEIKEGGGEIVVTLSASASAPGVLRSSNDAAAYLEFDGRL